MAQFQNMQQQQQHNQPNPLTSQPSLMQANSCQYQQLESLDSKPQFPRNISVSSNQGTTVTSGASTGGNPGTNAMEMSQPDMNNVGNIMVSMDSGINGTQSQQQQQQQPQFVAAISQSEVTPFLMNPTRRAETFVIEEVKMMLKEIEARKHILLSMSPSTNRLKRRAWEEVAISMANRWPHAPRRTADQVKKKWENLVSKTKRKVRAGHVTPDLDWNETNSAVMQFLTEHSPPIRLRYASMTPSQVSLPSHTQSNIASSSIANSFNNPTQNGYRNSGPFLGSFNSSTTQTTNLAMPPPPTPSQQQHPILPIPNAMKDEPQSPMISESDRSMNQSFQSLSSLDNIQFPKLHSDSSGDRSGSSDNCTGRQSSIPNHLNPTTTNLFQTAGPLNDSFLPHFPFNPSLVHFGLPSGPVTGPSPTSIPEPFASHLPNDWHKEFGDHLRAEHQMRMEILDLQKQAWTIQVELLNRERLRFQTTTSSSSTAMTTTNTPAMTCMTTTSTTSGTSHDGNKSTDMLDRSPHPFVNHARQTTAGQQKFADELNQLDGVNGPAGANGGSTVGMMDTEPRVPMEEDSGLTTY